MSPWSLRDTIFAIALVFEAGFSIGMFFGSVKCREPTQQERRKSARFREAKRVIEEAELMEYSAVAVPANQEALTTAVSKGLIRETERMLEPYIKAIVDANPRPKVLRVTLARPEIKVIRLPEQPSGRNIQPQENKPLTTEKIESRIETTRNFLAGVI